MRILVWRCMYDMLESILENVLQYAGFLSAWIQTEWHKYVKLIQWWCHRLMPFLSVWVLFVSWILTLRTWYHHRDINCCVNTLKLFYIKMVFPCHLPLCKVKLTKSEVIALGLKMPAVAGFKLPTGVICGSRSSASVLREVVNQTWVWTERKVEKMWQNVKHIVFFLEKPNWMMHFLQFGLCFPLAFLKEFYQKHSVFILCTKNEQLWKKKLK